MRKLFIAALACLCGAALAAVGGGTAHANVSGCVGTFQASSITFDRPSVSPGQLFTAATTIQNCTDSARTVGGYWLARTVVPAGAPYTMCTGNDPFPISQVSLAPGGTYTVKVTYGISSQCTATAIHVSVIVYSSPNVTQSADIAVDPGSTSPPPPTCAVGCRITSEWSTGFVAQVTITNRGTAPVNGWSLTFTFPGDQRVSNAWGATVTQNATAVAAVDVPWTAAIAPGGSVSFGMSGSWQLSDGVPAIFTLNGQECQAN